MGRSSTGIAVVRLFPTWQHCSCCPMQRCCGRLGLSSAAPWAVSSPLERGPCCHFPSFASCWVHRNGPAPFCAFLLQGRETLILIAPYAECQARGWAGIPLAPTQPARAWLLGKPGSHFTAPPLTTPSPVLSSGKAARFLLGTPSSPGGVGDVVQSSDGCWKLMVVVWLWEASVCVILGRFLTAWRLGALLLLPTLTHGFLHPQNWQLGRPRLQSIP